MIQGRILYSLHRIVCNYLSYHFNIILSVLLPQTSGFYPEAVLNLLTIAGSGFDIRHTDAMTLDQLVTHVSVNTSIHVL